MGHVGGSDVVMIYSRQELIQTFEEIKPGCADPGSPIWAQEDYLGFQCQYFICIPSTSDINRRERWAWCKENLHGELLCFTASDEKEWWGFTHREDIEFWILRWV